ncbi:four-helix bundle copper-binding protein [Magnetococcales bacterium HHB-1]
MSKQQHDGETNSINRREILFGLGAVGTGLAASALTSSSALASSHGGHKHDHSKASTSRPEHIAHEEVIDTALECVKDGAICLDGCIIVLGTGNPSMKECIRAVSEMLPACQTLARLASLNSKHLAKMAQVCIDVCNSCVDECKPHAEHHWECKNCMESCQKCIKACKKLVA